MPLQRIGMQLRKKKKRGFQYSSLTMGYWWEICTQLSWNKMQQLLPSRLSPQTEVCLAHCIQTICILSLVQTDVAQTYSCFPGSLQSCKLPAFTTDFPPSRNLEVCGFCGQIPLLQPKFLIFSHQKACRQSKSDSVGCWSWEAGGRRIPSLPTDQLHRPGACCISAWTTRQTLAKGELGLR